MHETTREYVALKTHEANEEGLLADRYIDYYRTTCLSAAAGARFRLADWLAWAELELDNFRAVLYGCVMRHDFAFTDFVCTRGRDDVFAAPVH